MPHPDRTRPDRTRADRADRTRPDRPADAATALDAALARVGDRWSLVIVDALREHPRRFGEIADLVPAVAPNILASRLRSLEAHGLVVAALYSARPPRAEYRLTDAGSDLAGAIEGLRSWGARISGLTDVAVHAACGSPLEHRWWCPTCDRPVDRPDADDVIHV